MYKKLTILFVLAFSIGFSQSYVVNMDGSNDYMSVSASDNATTKLTGQFSVSTWVFLEGSSRQQIIYNDGFELEWMGTGYNYFRMQPGGVNSVANMHKNQWHHVVMTRNSSNSIQIYVNGQKSSNYVSSDNTFDDVLYLGKDPDNGQYLDGNINEVAIWTTELNANQIDSLYNDGIPLAASNVFGAASALKSYWKLEQSTGTSATNSVANAASLTLYNSPSWAKFKHSAVPSLLYNIRSGSNSSYPANFIEYNGKIYFKADDGTKGYEMWEYDPDVAASSTNPKRISDLRSGSGNGMGWTEEWVIYKNKLIFVGNDGTYGDEIYSFDGTNFTRLADIYSGSSGSSPNSFTIYNDKLYFGAYSSTYGRELWVYDGTSVSLVKDLASGSQSGWGWGTMAVYNNKIYFNGYSTSTGYELYSYDGTDMALVKDISSGSYTSGSNSYPNSSYPEAFIVYDNKLFFKADDTTIGAELFSYDGTNVTSTDIFPGSYTSGSTSYKNASYPYFFTVFKDTLYFRARTSLGYELWAYDASKGARIVKDLYPGTYTSGSNTYGNSSYPGNLTVFDNKLYFSAEEGYNVQGSAGQEMYYYDGNNLGRVADIYPGSNGSSPYYFFATSDKMYFRARESSTGYEPYILVSKDPLPSIASVTSTTSNGTYKLGDAINITVNFSEAVTLSTGGSVTVTLETGSTDRAVTISSISGATSATASYTVQAGDMSSDLNVKSIAVSGTLSDQSAQIMEDFSIGSNLASSKALVVDGLVPTVASVKSTSTNTTYGTGGTINITVNFSEAVTISSSGSVVVTLETGSTDRTVSITSVSNATTATGTYTVQDGDTSNDLAVSTIALSSGATLKDAAGNSMSDFSVPADSNLSDFNDIVINTTKPGVPTGFVVNNNYGSVGLSWNAVSGATNYKIYRSESTSSFSLLTDTVTINSYKDITPSVTRYYYYVLTKNNLGDSSPSDTLHGYPSKIWYVEMGGSDSNDGKSKVTAFKTIEQAVKTNNNNLVSGDTIYVGPSWTDTSLTHNAARNTSGQYYDFGNISRGVDPDHTKAFVLIGTSGASKTIFNAEGKNRHFRFDNGEPSSTKIIGVTFFNGKEDDNWPGGGSIKFGNSSTKLQLIDCVFDSNRVEGNQSGGAVAIADQAQPSFKNCEFRNNWVNDTENSAEGGAVFINSPNNEADLTNKIIFSETKFVSNTVRAKREAYGGAVRAGRNTLFENCIFIKNGAIAGKDQSDANSWQSSHGGAIFSAGGWSNTGIVTVVANSTFDSNYVEVRHNNGWPRGTDIFYGYGSSNQTMKAYVFNSIITGSYRMMGSGDNLGKAYTEEEKYKLFATTDDDNRLYVNYSIIEGSTDQSWQDDNVYDISPVYNARSTQDYSLSILSPAIGQGTSTFESNAAPSVDILGNTRPNPSGSTIDIGAYENALSASTAPLPVTGITGIAKTNSAAISWSAVKSSLTSSTNASNIEYLIYQDGSQVGTSTGTSFTVPKLTNGTNYTFEVAAQDTSTSLTGAPSIAVTVKPVYKGPYWYVAASGGTASGTDNSDLGSREVPLNHISSAFEAAATGDTIVMLKGSHSGSNNRGIDWGSTKKLVVMGDPDYPADSTIMDAGGRARHFKFSSGQDTTNQIIGLTLYNGKINENEGGSSIMVTNGSMPVFRKVIFKSNLNISENWEGGTVMVRGSSNPSFYYCTFEDNIVRRTTGENSNDASGAAIFVDVNAYGPNIFLIIDGCIFKNNTAYGNWGARGGAIYTSGSQLKITNSLFYGNTAWSNAAGSNNYSSHGGAINFASPSYYSSSDNQWVGGKAIVINSTFANNRTVSGNITNTATSGSAIYLDSWSRNEKIWFFNNIVWGNIRGENKENGSTSEQVHLTNPSGWSAKNLNYNVIQNSGNLSAFQDDESFETDPTFADSTNGDFSLSNASGLIGQGGDSYESVSAPTKDLLGLVRPNPSGSKPDVGAYENSLAKTPYPAQIQNLTAKGGSGEVTLSWDTAADVDSVYNVYKHTSAFTPASTYLLAGTTNNTYTISGLDNTTRYYFRVSGVNKQGFEGTSAAIDMTPKFSGPVWWVATGGNDTSGEGSVSNPFKTIMHAMHEANEGDTITIKPGTYTGTDNRDFDLDGKNLVVMSQYPTTWDSVIIDAEKQKPHFKVGYNSNSSSTITASKTKVVGITLTNGEDGSLRDNGQPGGGSVSLYNGSSITFEKVFFTNNNIVNNSSTSSAGAVYMSHPGSQLLNCRFQNNQSILDQNGDSRATSAVGIDGMALNDNAYSSKYTLIDGCEFVNNHGRGEGGAINARHSTVIQNSYFYQNRSDRDDNTADGGAIAAMPTNSGDGGASYTTYLHVINSVFVDNYAERYGGAILNYGSNSPKIFNSIFMNNRRSPSGSTNGELNDFHSHNQAKIRVAFSRVDQAGTDEASYGEKMYYGDPAFVDIAKENFNLSAASSLIGAGTEKFSIDGLEIDAPSKDKNGSARPSPSGSSPDIGAYENALATSPYPSQVQNVTGVIGSGQVALNWDANTETDITKYYIYASTVKDYNPAPEDSVGESTSNAFTATGLTNNTEYHFRVAAVNNQGYRGNFSEQLSLIPMYKGPEWFVDNINGSGNNDGSQNSPFQSIKQALLKIVSGDTIILLPGEHLVNDLYLNLNTSGDQQSFGVHFRGSTGDYRDVLISANYQNRLFNLQNNVATFKHITFTRGSVGGDNAGGGALMIDGGSDVEFNNCHFFDNQSQHNDFQNWSGGGAVLARDIKRLVFKDCVFRNNRVTNSGLNGSAVLVDHPHDSQSKAVAVFERCYFVTNGVYLGNDLQEQRVGGGVININGAIPRIEYCAFDSTDFQHNYASGAKVGLQGGAVWMSGHYTQEGSFTNEDYAIFNGNIIRNTNTRVTRGTTGFAASISNYNLKFTNNLIYKNRADGSIMDVSSGERISAGVFIVATSMKSDGSLPKIRIVNNTIVDNYIQNIDLNNAQTPGLAIVVEIDNKDVVVGNNIFYNNDIQSQANDNYKDFNIWASTQEAPDVKTSHNMIEDGPTTIDEVSGKPSFKNPSTGNYELSSTSAAVDAGVHDLPNEVDAPIDDIRGFYRVGPPDLGAFEQGASKYLLAFSDDIDGDDPQTFVKLGQEITFTITTNDIDGNQVSSNEPVTWSIFPNDRYATLQQGADTSSAGGDAIAKVLVTSAEKGKGFRFRLRANIGGAFLSSDTYVIEELVTGAPPPVLSLKITPEGWSTDSTFSLDWEIPTWSEERDYIGALLEIKNETNDYEKYIEFPSGSVLKNYTFEVKEPGTWHTEIWLVDELGNEDQDSASAVTAYFDNIRPEDFYIYNPNSYEDESGVLNTFYSSDKPRFEWENKGDYPSKIKEWEIYTEQQGKYGTYTLSDVTFSEGSDMVYINGATSLPDGYYDWWVVAVDSAGNPTPSNTGYFGVDLSPPNIAHSNALTVIDENQTATIKAVFDDAASGVNWGLLHYRRAGSGGVFVTADLYNAESNSYNILGSDVKAEGLEYYIDSEDNIGNYAKWPKDKAFQSVKVRTEGSVSTAGNLSLPGGVDSTNYIFFSIPFDVGNGIGAFKAMMDPANEGPDEFKYRLYAYNNGWQENPSSLTMGNGYFFIFDPDKYSDFLPLQFDFGQGVSTVTDPPYKVNVTPGQWKFFGLPYNFNVPLSNVYTESGASLNDAGSIYTWSSSWTGAGSTLQPWKGYIFKSGGDTELNIDARGDTFGKMAESFDPDDTPMDANEWIVDIIAATGNTRDELNSVGVRNNAKDGYDRLDEFEPPTVPGNITLRIDNRDRELSPDIYAIDIRKPNETGHYWDLQVYTPTNGQRTYITFEGLGYVPQEYDIFIINKTNKQAKNLKWESTYRFANTGSEGYLRQDLRLVIGTKQFVEENNAGVNLYPDAFTLSQNYPNPFNPQTSIRISLEEDANIDLIIYNLLGEEITRLAANEYRPSGYYNFIWNGRNAMGNKVSTGVYLYHAMVRDNNGKVVLNKTKKMIFLK